MKRRIAAALLGTALLTAVALAPSAAAVPGTSAHQSNYVGYGCSGWTEVRFFPPLAAQDCWAGQQSGGWLLMRHDYSGVWAPGTYLTWERLY
jgi:hypothetical protein